MSHFDLLPPSEVAHTFQTEEGTLHYQDLGEGPPVLFIHSFGPQPGVTAWMIYHEVLQRLALSRRCIALDMPNFGLSGPVVYSEPFHDVVVRSALRLLDRLDLDRIPVVGSSMGATVALDLALQEPDRVSGLIVGACHASTGGDPYLMAAFPSEVQRLYDEAQRDPTNMDLTRRLLRAIVYDQSQLDEAAIGQIQEFRESRPDHWAAVSSSTSHAHSNLNVLSTIDVPVHIVHGRFDRMVPFEQALMIMSYLNQADVSILNRCGHWPPFERPLEFTGIVESWLARWDV